MVVLYQITMDGKATSYVYDKSMKNDLIDKLIELKTQEPRKAIDFLIINL